MEAAHQLAIENLWVTVVSRDRLAHTDEGPQRGHAHIGGDEYPPHAPGRLDFGPLLLVAQGEMRPGEGFPMHSHRGIENVLLMLGGQIRHADNQGAPEILGPDHMMLLSAGRGAEHAEFVHGDQTVHALVIWLRPDDPGAPPALTLGEMPRLERRNTLQVLASPTGGFTGRMRLRCDARLMAGVLEPGVRVTHEARAGRLQYLLPTSGAIEVNGRRADVGDRVMCTGAGTLEVVALEATEVVLLDMPDAG